ncbi:MAG: hypothetical protein K6T16_01250 [Candidatus Pacearchaeota archaeon]|nr:hypothetical protein [Candidatus Pacearchaeota archaeon]
MEEEKAKENIEIEDKELKKIEHRRKGIDFSKIVPILKNNPKLWIIIITIILLVAIIGFSSWARTQNIPYLRDVTTGQYTLGPDLDPFLFLRYAQTIEKTGTLPKMDIMRYTPLGGVPTQSLAFIPYTIFYLYKFLSIFSSDMTIEYAAIIYPVICFAIGLLFFFLFVQKLSSYLFKDSEKKLIYSVSIALIATLLLAVFPSYLHRTMAGIPEKEAPGMFFFWLAFYCFLSAWQSKGNKSLVMALIAGTSTGLMSWVWGGVRFIFMTFSLFAFLTFLLDKMDKRQKFVYSVWLIVTMLLVFLVSGLNGTRNFFSGVDTLFAFGVFSFIVGDYLIYNTKLKESLSIEKIKLPHSVVSVLIVLVLGLILVTIFFGFSFIVDKAKFIKEGLLYPFGRGRVGLTVAENRQPYFVDWFNEFTPFFFWVFFIGMIFLFYEATKNFNKKRKGWINFFFVLFLTTFIFSRYSDNKPFLGMFLLNGENPLSQVLYFGGLFVFLFAVLFIYLKAYIKKDDETLESYKNIHFAYLFVLAFVFWMILASRGAIRLFFIAGPGFILVASLLPLKLFTYHDKKDYYPLVLGAILIVIASILITQYSPKLLMIALFVLLAALIAYMVIINQRWEKILVFCSVLSIIFLLLGTFLVYEQATVASARATVPGAYYQQWQKAMAWVRENTTEDALFIHWWDYGYWVQTIGKRATVTDGGHFTEYWDHLIGRYLLTAQNEKTALRLCKSYGADYLLIDSTDVGKYPAYSSIGSDETGHDRLSWINTFVLDEKQTQETKNETAYVYVGGSMVDQDIGWENYSFPRAQAIIGGFIMVTDKEKGTIKEIKAVIFYDGKQYRVPIRYAYINGEWKEFEKKEQELITGALYFIPRVTQQGIKSLGAALYLSEKALNAEWVKLYLFDESENFELVHKQDALFIEQLKQLNVSVGDFVYAGDFIGPIKIWKINYPEDIKTYKEYLEIPEGWNQNTGPWATLDHLGE